MSALAEQPIQALANDEPPAPLVFTDSAASKVKELVDENRKLKEERESLAKAAAWFATESGPSKRSSGS